MEMTIIGLTDQQQAFVASKEKSFRIGEFLIIEDRNKNGDLISEIRETQTYNRYMPLSPDQDLMDEDLKNALEQLGYDLDDGTIYLGKLHPVLEPSYPIETGSSCRIPRFEEIKPYFLTQEPEKGLIIGTIKNSDTIYKTVEGEDERLKNLLYTFEGGEFFKQNEIPYIMDLYGQSQYPHIGIFGGSGSGKSYGMRVVLEELMAKDIPAIVLDPHYEMDFSIQAKKGYGPHYDSKFSRYRIGKNIGVKFEDISTGELKTLLNAISSLSEAMDAALDILHDAKDSYYTFSKKLQDLQKGFKLENIGNIQDKINNSEGEDKKAYGEVLKVFQKYQSRVNASSVTAILWRLESLHRQGIFEKNIVDLEQDLLARKLCVVQGSLKMMQIFSSYLLRRIYRKRREYRDGFSQGEVKDFFPPFFVITDEAHNFAPQSNEIQVPTKGQFREIAQEGRKYGVFLILATQRPTLLDSTVTAQLNTKMIFRTTRGTDIETIREETDISKEQAKRLPYLKTGDVFLSESALGRTIYVRIRGAHTMTPHKENPFDELANFSHRRSDEFYRMIHDKLPIDSTNLTALATVLEEEYQWTEDITVIEDSLEKLVKAGKLQKKENFLGFSQYEEVKHEI
ncbi:MAG: ATP-binding protein [Tissierellia bacterium]|nr:ATP-binding protein [Tissierellia bacterium]